MKIGLGDKILLATSLFGWVGLSWALVSGPHDWWQILILTCCILTLVIPVSSKEAQQRGPTKRN